MRARIFTVYLFLLLDAARGFSVATLRNGGNVRDTALLAAPTAPRDMASLTEWADKNGVSFRNGARLAQADAEKDDWGVVLEEDTEAGSVILSVPMDLVFSSNNLRADLEREGLDLAAAVRHLEKRNEELVSHFLLCVKILREWTKGKESKWHAWLQALPQTFDTALYMDEVEIDLLPPFGSALANLERYHFQEIKEAFELAKESNDVLDSVDSKLLQWTFSVVFSRSWRSEDLQDRGDVDRSDIVPLGDMFNHNADANIFVEYESADGKTVNFVLKEDAPAGSALNLCYGLPTNPYRFLCIFGFIDENQPEIFSQILFANPSEEHIALGCNDRTKMVFRTEDGAVGKYVWDSVLYALLEQKPDAQRDFVNGDESTRESILSTYRLEVALTIRNHVDNTYKEIEDLLKKAKGVEPSNHTKLPIIQRLNERMLSIFGKVKDGLEHIIWEESRRRMAAKGASR